MAQYDNEQDDATLVHRILDGEREVYSVLLLHHAPSVIRLCRRMLTSPLEAEDVAQEAAIEAFLRLADLRDPARFGAWLHGIAANLARMALRRRTVLPLAQPVDETSMIILGAQAFRTPEDAYASREVHDSILAALTELPLPTRAAVVGFFLDGYSYAELGELLGVPISTVRGRLYQGRQHLRRALGPLVREGALASQRATSLHPKEIIMEQPELVEVVISSLQKMPSLKGKKNYGVVLRELSTAVELRIVLGEAEAEAIQHARGEVSQASPPPLSADLTLRLLALTTAKVEHIVIDHLIEASFYATVMVVHGEQRTDLDVRLGEGLALASACGAPIYVKRPLLDEFGIDTQPELPDEQAEREFRLRLAAEVDAAVPSILTPAPLPAEIQMQVDAGLGHLCLTTGAITALLIHRSGTLIGAHSPVDRGALRHYSKALVVDAPPFLADLRKYKGLLMDDIFTPDAWLLFWSWQDWQVQISGLEDALVDPDDATERLKVAVRELADLCVASISMAGARDAGNQKL